MIEEIGGSQAEYTRQQQWSHFATLLVAVFALLFGLNMRANTLNATTLYDNLQAGVRVNYPANWLIDERGDYVFRVRDMTRIGYKTSMQIATQPVGDATSESFVQNQLDLRRALTRGEYTRLSSEPFTLPDDISALRTEYTFVSKEINPFAEPVLIPVRGVDIITLQGGQAIVITFLADALTFAEDVTIFERFLNNLEF